METKLTFDELHEKAVFYLNALMHDKEVSKQDRWVLKLNRMTRNLNALHDELRGEKA